MLTCSSVTGKSATGCGLGTKTFSEWSEDAASQDAAGRDVENFRRQPVDLRRYYIGDTVLERERHGTQIFTEAVCLLVAAI